MWSSLSGFDFLGFVEEGLVFGLMACFIIFDGMLDVEIRNILEITWSPGYFFLPPEKICFWHVVRLEADHFNPVRDLADSRLDFTHCKADLCCSPFLLKHRPSKIPTESLGVYKGLSILVGPGLPLLTFPAWDYRKFWVSFLASQATAEVRSLSAASLVALHTSLARTVSYGYP